MQRLFAAGLLSSALVLPGVAAAQTAPGELFKDKTLTIIVNYGAGGNVDTEARIYQRHLPKHLPGKPTIIVQNIIGAAGMNAVNQLGLQVNIKEPSLTIGFMTFNALAPIIDDPSLKVKVEVFRVVAGVGSWYAAYSRKDILPAPGRPQDIAKAKGVYAAGYARSSNHDIRLRLMFELMGTDYKVVTGFQSVGAINKAIAQGEIGFMLSTLPGYETQAVPQLIETGIAIPLWQLGATGDDGKQIGSPELTKRGMKHFEEVFEDAHGKRPSGPRYAALQLSNDSSAKLARMVMMPPSASNEALAAVRKAFVDILKDADFVAEHQKIIKAEPILFPADQAERSLMKAIKDVDPAVKRVLKEAAGVE